MNAIEKCIDFVKIMTTDTDYEVVTKEAAAELAALRERVGKLEEVEAAARRVVQNKKFPHRKIAIEELTAALFGDK